MVRAQVPVTRVRGSRRDGHLIFMSLLAGMVAVGGRQKLGEVGKGTGRARLCAYVNPRPCAAFDIKHLTCRGGGPLDPPSRSAPEVLELRGTNERVARNERKPMVSNFMILGQPVT